MRLERLVFGGRHDAFRGSPCLPQIVFGCFSSLSLSLSYVI